MCVSAADTHVSKNETWGTPNYLGHPPNNLVYFGNSAGVSIGGYASAVGGTDHATIVNNTLFKNDGKNTGSGEFQIQYHATNNVFKNNVVYAGSQGLVINSYNN